MFACKCLNILIHTENNDIQKVELESLELSAADKNDAFFKKEIGRVLLENISKEQAGLVKTRSVGPWIIHRCLNCSLDTHAVHRDKGASFVIVAPDMLSGTANISSLRNSENYSSAFRLLINSETNEQIELSKIAVSQLPGNVQLALSGLQQQLADVLRREVAGTEERIRLYTEMQYTNLETFREQAHREHLALVRLVLNSNPEEEISTKTNGSSLSSPSSQSGDVDEMAAQSHSHSHSPSPRQNVNKPRHPIVTNLTKTKRPIARQLSQPVNRLESLDAEGLFPLDGMDESPVLTHSDVEESDTDDSASHDEGIHIPRQRGASLATMAKSLPMNIPVFMSAFTHDLAEDKDEPKVTEDAVDIAASIKALAKSVHGDAVFGDLPRPRFSTQI